MFIEFYQIEINNKDVVLSLFKEAAIKIAKMNVDHWQYWKNPPLEKIKWVEEGIENKEFYFIKNTDNEIIGMVRILEEDLLYWGKQEDKSLYVHSLVVREHFNKKGLGKIILDKVESLAQQKQYKYLRLDAVSTNVKLCKYYEKQGFNKVGVKELNDTVNNLYQRKV
ncbi:GNAT family N-acetyltransferase [uncultured Tenacibaculum sp.]|uniref:GNAT family N-acetyltransferase n=1 Tax=uncultured Tenacibaculum sp. TaxID=174713 RepID=UPI002622A634|nr:GNAT family N-acetyltransferase [uncultured Tenacibaculum sp.]